MTRRAVLSDIHGNLEALDAVLADVATQAPEAIVCLGDFVGYGASPNECITRLRPRIEAAVLGNHDVAALGRLKLGGFNSDAATSARWTQTELADEHRAWLDALPFTLLWRGLRIVHATPSEPEEWNYVLSIQDAEYEFDAFEESLCLIGHSHVPGQFTLDGQGTTYARRARVDLAPGPRRIINVGSVGQPRDGDPRAAWALLDPKAGWLEHRRVEYDIEAAAARITAAGLPSFLAERLRWGE